MLSAFCISFFVIVNVSASVNVKVTYHSCAALSLRAGSPRGPGLQLYEHALWWQLLVRPRSRCCARGAVLGSIADAFVLRVIAERGFDPRTFGL